MVHRLAVSLAMVLTGCLLASAQGLSPLTPAREYIRLNGQVIAVENAQLIANGGFETDSLGPWILNNGGASVGTTAYSGSYGLALGGSSASALVYQDEHGFIPGQMYQISVWVKSSNTTSNGVQLYLHDTQGNGAVATNANPGTSWQQISGVFTATVTGALRIHLVQFSGAVETTSWDDVTVTPLPPNGDFETGTLSPWFIAGGSASIGSISHGGVYDATLGGTTTQSWIFQDVAGLIPGQMYEVSVWVESSSASNNGVELWLHDTQGNGLVSNTITPGTGWQQFSVAFTATAVGKLRIHLIQLSGTSENTYWDDVTVRPLPPNGGFETASLSPWLIAGGNAAVGATAHTGAYSANLGGTTTQSWIYQDVAGLVPGQTYQVSAWVTSSSSSTNGVQLWVHDTQGNGASSAFLSLNTSWQQISTSFTATSTGKLRIHLVQLPGTSETTYWEDVTVSPVSTTNNALTATTANSTKTATPPAKSNSPIALSPSTRYAAGSSSDPIKTPAQIPPTPAGTAKAAGSSAVPVLPVNQTSPPRR